MSDNVQAYIEAHSKSHMAGFFLTLFFGPLGLFYSSWVAALILCTVVFVSLSTIPLSPLSPFVPILCWLAAMVLTFYFVGSHNKKVIVTAKLHNS
ncbi:MAG: hypothetical protein GY787_26010 [Alteromonadales bacterium]|nr:hypothetical protein [Alteromonadales bacterium]